MRSKVHRLVVGAQRGQVSAVGPLCLLLFAGAPAYAEDQAYAIGIAEVARAATEPIHISGAWRYHKGDDAKFARRDFDDSTWRKAESTRGSVAIPGAAWGPVQWFRRWLRLDANAATQKLSLGLSYRAAIEVYVDGRLIRHDGDIEVAKRGGIHPTQQPPVFTPLRLSPGRHLIAVRYASTWLSAVARVGRPSGFFMLIGDEHAGKRRAAFDLHANRLNIFFIGVALALAALHLLLFLFYPEAKANLYYSLATLSLGLVAFCTTYFGCTDVARLFAVQHVFGAAVVAASLFNQRFYYAVFLPRVPRLFWPFAVVGLLIALGARWLHIAVVYGFALISFGEQLRVLIWAQLRRRRAAWIICVGGATQVVGTFLTILTDVGLLPEQWVFSYLYGALALLFSMSVYLAHSSARDKRRLAQRVHEVEQLSAQKLEQERLAREQAVAREALQAENARQELALQEAQKREAVLKELEAANRRLRETQVQLVQSEKMAALGQLVAGLSHEINTPIGAIGSVNDSLARATSKLEAVAADPPRDLKGDRGFVRALRSIGEAHQVIAEGGSRIGEIVKRLQSFARLDEAELKLADIHACIDDALVLAEHQLPAGVRIERHYGELPPLACYPRQLNQLFLNLLVNAGQAIGDTGCIRIETKLHDQLVVVRVRDSGSGIAAELLPKIFDPGFTTKGVGVGTGLGLSICYRIATAHEGQIEVESKPGGGTTFTLTLPTDLHHRAIAAHAPVALDATADAASA